MNPVLPINQQLAQPENGTVVRKLLQTQPTLTRTQLARELCRQPGWRDAKGDWQVATTAQALRDLEGQGHWTLPKPRVRRTRTWATRRACASPSRPPAGCPPNWRTSPACA